MVDRSSDSRVLAQESGLRIVLTLISGSRVFALGPEISVAFTKANHFQANHFDIGLCVH